MSTLVRTTLEKYGRLATRVDRLDDDADLHDAGLDSMAMVNVMLALEQALDVEFPEAQMSRKAFSSIAALDAVLLKIAPGFAAAGMI